MVPWPAMLSARVRVPWREHSESWWAPLLCRPPMFPPLAGGPMMLSRSLLAILLLQLPTTAAFAEDSRRSSRFDVMVEGADRAARRAVSSSDPDRRRVSVRLTGGLGELRGGDVNDGVAFWSAVFESSLNNGVVGLQPGDGGKPAALRRGTELGADVIVHLTPRVAMVGGVGRVDASSEGAIEHAVVYARWRGMTRNATALRVSSVPLRLGAQFTTPVGRRVRLAVEGGGGLYFTRLSWLHELDVNGRLSSWVSETRGHDIGWHGGVWIDVGLADRFGLVLGVEVVRAEVGGLRGFRKGTFSYRSPTRDDGELTMAGWDLPQFLIVGQGSWVNERYGPVTPVREATVGLGGLRFRGGLRIGL